MPPQPLTEQITLVFTVLGGLSAVGAAFTVGHRTGYRSAKKALNSERNMKRFTEIYAPLVALFVTCHVTRGVGRGDPCLRQRFRNAYEELTRNYSPFGALFALFTNPVLVTFGKVEYGGEFPLQKIITILRDNVEFADPGLVNLARIADRTRNEEKPDASRLTEVELDLAEYIYEEYTRLSRRFIQA